MRERSLGVLGCRRHTNASLRETRAIIRAVTELFDDPSRPDETLRRFLALEPGEAIAIKREYAEAFAAVLVRAHVLFESEPKSVSGHDVTVFYPPQRSSGGWTHLVGPDEG